MSDYKVKVMIAEPKGKRGRRDPLFSDAFAHAIQQPGVEYGAAQLGAYSAMSEPPACVHLPSHPEPNPKYRRNFGLSGSQDTSVGHSALQTNYTGLHAAILLLTV